MVVIPLYWDQYDNAQRVAELGYGIRLETYTHEPEDLAGAIDRLLDDQKLNDRMQAIAKRLQTIPGTRKAADLIERVAAGGRL